MKRRTLEKQIQDAFDGEPDVAGSLRGTLLEDPAALELWCDYAIMESELRRHAGGRLKVPGTVPARRLVARRAVRRRKYTAAFAAAAALVLCAVALKSFIGKPGGHGYASLSFTPGTILRDSSGDIFAPERLEPGKSITLARGVLQIELPDGVLAVIEGPSIITYVSTDRFEMNGGHAWFRLPPETSSFTVKSPALEASASSGGEFGVDFREDQPTSVQAFTASVEAKANSGVRDSVSISGGEAAAIIPGGRWTRATAVKRDFLDRLPDALPMFHMDFDRIDDGTLAIEGNGLGSASARALIRNPQGIRLVPGVRGMALDFDGTGGWIETNWPGISGTAPRTVSLWCRIAPGTRVETAPPLALWGNPVTGWNRKFKFALVSQKDGRVTLRGSFGERLANGARDLADGIWHHLALVYRGNDEKGEPLLEFYVDGEKEAAAYTGESTEVVTDTKSDMALGLSIGRYELQDRGRNPFLKATLDELKIHAGALEPGEIRELSKQR